MAGKVFGEKKILFELTTSLPWIKKNNLNILINKKVVNENVFLCFLVTSTFGDRITFKT